MYSLSIDYIFNRVYDCLLWIKYFWLFVILREDKGVYLDSVSSNNWDGLRDRGWFDDYLAKANSPIPEADISTPLWQSMLDKLGIKLRDSDGDGVPDVTDSRKNDPTNLTSSELKERYEADYSFWDNLKDIFGLSPSDSDKDGVPNSYEEKHNMDKNSPDSDSDGLLDGQELTIGTDPLNNDTDRDGVIDGRDEAPIDGLTSSIGKDADGDGVSDKIENILGTDINKFDTDSDGIPDNMDTYPTDPNNLSQIPGIDLGSVDGITFHIQNPILSFVSDVLSILTIAFIVFLAISVILWFISAVKGATHYEHHFHGDDHKEDDFHKIKDTSLPVHNLPVHEDAPTLPPTIEEFKDHPRFAIIKGYMSSPSEALWRIGIMEGDNLLESVLREKGYIGENLSELLKGASFKTVSLAWDAHKIRNRIAHEGSNFELTEHEAKKAYHIYEEIFRELKVIK